MSDNHRGLYKIKKGFRDTDGTYYRTGTEIKLLKDPRVKSLVREGKLKEVKEDIRPESTFRNEEEKREAMERGEDYPQIRRPSERCPKGYHIVLDHYRKRNGSSMALEEEGVYVSEHCAKNPRKR